MRIEGLKFKTENKNEITILVDIYSNYNELEFRIIDILIKPYRKQKSISIRDRVVDEYSYRSLDYDKRVEYLQQEYMKYVTKEQMKEALLNVWERIKPNEIKVF